MLRFPTWFPLAITLVLAGCGGTSHADLVPQPTQGMPAFFVGSSSVVEAAGMSCRSPLRDPEGVVVLSLVRSGRNRARPSLGWGDYSVSPAGSYGLQPDQLVRVECGSGKPAGVVPR